MRLCILNWSCASNMVLFRRLIIIAVHCCYHFHLPASLLWWAHFAIEKIVNCSQNLVGSFAVNHFSVELCYGRSFLASIFDFTAPSALAVGRWDHQCFCRGTAGHFESRLALVVFDASLKNGRLDTPLKRLYYQHDLSYHVTWLPQYVCGSGLTQIRNCKASTFLGHRMILPSSPRHALISRNSRLRLKLTAKRNYFYFSNRLIGTSDHRQYLHLRN